MNTGRLTDKHREIAVLAATGTLQNKEIAMRVGVHPNTVTRVLKLPEVQAFIAEMQQAVEQETVTNLVEAFDQAAGEAFQKLRKLMAEAPPAVALRAAESVLDRSRVAPKRQIHTKHDMEGEVRHLHIPAPQLRYLHEVVLEAADDPSEVPSFPELSDDEELLVEVDRKTGEILSERKSKVQER